MSVFEELSENRVGKKRILTIGVEEMVILLLRDILESNLFVQEVVSNSNNLVNERLIKLSRYIQNNLKNDLSNRELSLVAGVSEDYIGQYFKALTNINPQNYVEEQRMDRAIQLLYSTNKSIGELSREVGYRDSSYFCRRFKMMFGISAVEMRRRHAVG